MGPYYLTALVALLGPIKRISGSTRISYPERTVLSTPKAGTKIEVSSLDISQVSLEVLPQALTPSADHRCPLSRFMAVKELYSFLIPTHLANL